ncbi:MAG: hypothetical protein AAFY26_20370 [Cyanobacteria bacterium J06638_22]
MSPFQQCLSDATPAHWVDGCFLSSKRLPSISAIAVATLALAMGDRVDQGAIIYMLRFAALGIGFSGL